jgi:hypothetical protein
MNKVFCCKGKRLANYLIEQGCKIIRIDNDQKSNGFLVFIFEYNDILKYSLEKWELDKFTYMF